MLGVVTVVRGALESFAFRGWHGALGYLPFAFFPSYMLPNRSLGHLPGGELFSASPRMRGTTALRRFGCFFASDCPCANSMWVAVC